MSWTSTNYTSAQTVGGGASTIFTDTTNGTKVITVDLTLMATLDVIIIDLYQLVQTAGAYVLLSSVTFTGAQAIPGVKFEPVDSPYGFKMTVNQTAGTARALPILLDTQ